MTGTALIGIGYAVAAALCVRAWRWQTRRRERTTPRPERVSFWLLCAVLLATMSIGRISRAASFAGDVGRHLASSEGWYENRRPLQFVVVVAILVLWAALVVSAMRRRHAGHHDYFAMTLAVTTLLAMAAIRTISLHYVDTVLNRWHLAGIEVGDILEVGGLLAAITIAWRSAPETSSIGS